MIMDKGRGGSTIKLIKRVILTPGVVYFEGKQEEWAVQAVEGRSLITAQAIFSFRPIVVR